MTHQPKNDILADPRELLNHRLDGADLTLEQIETLLSSHPDILALTNQLDPQALASYRQLFEKADLNTIVSHFENKGWLQFGLTPVPGSLSHLYAAIGDFLDQSKERSLFKNAFFAHKPPGLRLRVQVDPFQVASLAHPICDMLQRWRASGLITADRREIYEPEVVRFGGKDSMNHVHALFSKDSDFWLQFHAAEENRPHRVQTALILLRHIFSGLDIVEWEDLVVWQKMGQRTGASAFVHGQDAANTPHLEAHDIVTLWNTPDPAMAAASPALITRRDAAGKALERLARRWKTQCFDSGDTSMCIRDAAARYAVVLFNRAGVPATQQSIIAGTLANRMAANA